MSILRVLIVDDSEADTKLLLRELQKAGHSPEYKRVDNAADMKLALSESHWDIVLCDFVMPEFSGQAALDIFHEQGLDIPLIVVSGKIGEDVAVEAMKAGARDYVFKGNLKRLVPAVDREIEEARVRRERRKTEEALRLREEELFLAKQAEQLKDEFIGMVSHELNTPLTVIIGALSVANSEGLSQDEVKGLINDAAEEADRLAVIVENLLELSRHQFKRLNLDTSKTDIVPIIDTVLRRLRARSSRHSLVTDIQPELPRVLIDKIRVERVLYNLVENAIKYSPDGGEIKIDVRCTDGQLIVRVLDHGIGISTENQKKLFQGFQRLDIQKKYKVAGVGLGLRVCLHLVEAHGGRIWVESEPGKGSAFSFSLPVIQGMTPAG